MKEIILKILIEKTEYEHRYTGGREEPEIIVFKDSEDRSQENYLAEIAEEIEKAINR